MHARDQDKARFFDRQVCAFDKMHFSAEEARKLEWFRARWQIEPGMTVLEPGCGAGRLTQYLAEWVGPDGVVIAVDLSPEMIKAHHHNVQAPNVLRYCQPILSLDLPRESVEVVICFHAFPHFDNRVETLRCFARLLRPGGRVCLAHFAGRDKINEIHMRAGGPVGGDTIPPAEEMRELFRQAGLHVKGLIDRSDRYHLHARRLTSPSAPK